MADKANKLRENVEGAWYVDNTCTPCRVCLDEAPNLLKYNDDETYAYFYKQPENDEETAAAQRAMDVCPTPPMGNDGRKLSPRSLRRPQEKNYGDRPPTRRAQTGL